MPPQHIHLDQTSPETLRIALSGEWTLSAGIHSTDEVETTIASSRFQRLILDCTGVEKWDSGLMVFLVKIAEICKTHGVQFDDQGLAPGMKKLLRLSTAVPREDDRAGLQSADSILSRLGQSTLRLKDAWADALEFIGEIFLSGLRFLRGRGQFKKSDLWQLIEEAGIRALPIVTLINFLTGMILAFVASVQLRTFGAEIYVADLVAIAMVREMAPMMTAIILAGRSGASYAATLGTMTVNEEIDALATMGFSPIDFLVTPRLLALTLMTPLLVLYADFMGMIGGAVVGQSMLGLSFTLYLNQTISALNPLHFLLGLIKATVYGGLVAFAGCYTGMRSGRSAAAVGSATTRAVVMGIVMIIAASAITTIIYSLFGY
jgi:phospholipid/cholesterol/gamma-HCH transport system permease protein